MANDKVHLMSFSFFDQSDIECTNKIDAAKRQLIGAIRFYFQEIDSIIVWQLAANAQEIICSLLKKVDKSGFEDFLVCETGLSKKEIFIDINKYRNFAKHADKDPNGIINEVKSEDVEGLLIAPSLSLIALEGRSPIEVQVFYHWYCALYPEKVSDEELKGRVEAQFPNIVTMDKSRQLEMGISTIRSALKSDYLLRHLQTDTSHLFRWEGK